MIYRKLAKANLEVSVIGLGTHQFSGEWGVGYNSVSATKLISEAHGLGINLIDTAPSYGAHLSENLIGKALKNKRSEWVIATKFGQCFDKPSNKTSNDFSVRAVKKQLADSLRALKTDYIDIYQFHSGSNKDFENQDLWSFLNTQIDKGTIKSLGVSFSNDLIESNDTFQLDRLTENNISVTQLVYNRLSKKAEDIFIPQLSKMEIGIIGRIPLAKGFLSGKYQPGHSFNDSHRSSFNTKFNDELLTRAASIKSSEVPEGVPMSSWSLGWCLNNDNITAVVPGSKNIEQLKSNASSIDLINKY